MPSSDDRKERVKALFQEALDLEEQERPAFLAEACADDETLRAEVQDLLGALAQASGFLADPSPRADEQPGARIDRYRLVERIGEGGFGIVFRAEQVEPLRREVALKILKRGMDSERVVRRFDQERQALARMQHPHIAAVFDGGTTPSGRPYFVMELVGGQPITKYCQERGLGVEQRVALMQRVCLAVQHAHNKGVVHRDLKPANILVSETDDGEPVPKVIDFGIAKAIDPDDGPGLGLSATANGQPIGTLEYMAPEQASGSADVDSRADVYSLGVVLYELLTGRRPFERGDAPSGHIADVLLRIRTETAVRPSLCVQRTPDAPLPDADAARWSRRLRGDLDWIVVQALEKDPGERYPTANALAEDLQRFLCGRAVEAGPPTAAYQLRCLIARHRVAFGAASLLLASLVAGFVGTTSALTDAHRESERRERTLGALKSMLLTADPALQKGPDYTVRELLDDFAEGLGPAFDQDPVVAGELRLTIGGAYRNLGEFDKAEPQLRQALEAVRATTFAGDPRRLQVMHEWAHLLRDSGRFVESEQVVDEALRTDTGRVPAQRLHLLLSKADLRRLQGDHASSARLAGEALAMLDRGVDGPDPRPNRAAAFDLLGAAATASGDYEGALELYQRALALRVQCYGNDKLVVSVSHTNIADCYRALGRPAEAELSGNAALDVQRRWLGERHPEVARTISLLGDLAILRGELDVAEARFREAHEIRLERLPEAHAERATGHLDFARLALARKQPDAAEPELRRAIELQIAAGARTHTHAAALQNLGVALMDLQRPAEAVPFYEQAHALHLELGGEQKPAVTDCLQNLALAKHALGDHEAAVALHERALALRLRHHPEDRRRIAASLAGIASSARAAGDLVRAARADAERAEQLERTSGEDPQRVVATRARAGRTFLDAGEHEQATPLLEAVHEWCERELAGEWPLGETKSLLAECRLAAGDLDGAAQLAEEALPLLEACPAKDKIERARATAARVRQAREAGTERHR